MAQPDISPAISTQAGLPVMPKWENEGWDPEDNDQEEMAESQPYMTGWGGGHIDLAEGKSILTSWGHPEG